jgi:dTDP-4-dehydrorhamnose 3,5-epimerase
MLIPAGFAHGFQAMSDECELIYVHSAMYDAAAATGLNALDPTLDIRWPEAVGSRSARDSSFPFVTSDYQGVDQ